MTHTFQYLGHTVDITEEFHKKCTRYWFSIDGRPINFSSRLDTAKRLATRFIDVVNDAHYDTSRQLPMYKPRLC